MLDAVHPLTATAWFTSWQFSWPGALLTLLVAVPYVAALVSSRGRELPAVERPSTWRIVAYLVLGAGLLAYATCGPIGVYAPVLMWVFGLQVGLLTALIPLGIGLGRPVDLACLAAGSTRPRRLLGGRVGRLLMFPLFSSLAVTASVIAVFYTGYGTWALGSQLGQLVLVAHLLVVGVLVALPLLTDELLPGWATPAMRTLVGVVDGLLDAIPGILLMTAPSLVMPRFPGFAAHYAHARGGMSASLDQRFAGGALLAVAESVGLPLLGAVFLDWIRSDERDARRIDAQLDAQLEAAEDGDGSTIPWWLES